MKRSYLITAGVLIIITVAVLSHIKDRVPDNIYCLWDIGTYRASAGKFEVNSSRVVGQSFVPNFDNLFMMSIFVPRQDLDREGELIFQLKENIDAPDDLVRLKWRYDQVRFDGHNFYAVPPERENSVKGFHFFFNFTPIRHTKGRRLYFSFSSPAVKPGKGIMLGVWDNIDHYEALSDGRMFVNGTPARGFLAFRSFNTLEAGAGGLFSTVKKRFLKDSGFCLFYCALLAAILLCICLLKFAAKEA